MIFKNTFEAWWSEFWTTPFAVEVMNVTFKDIAFKAWEAGELEGTFVDFNSWWDRFWTHNFNVEVINLAFKEVSEKAWNQAPKQVYEIDQNA